MKTKYDYIIVGAGLAGISFCETLKSNNKTFIVIDNHDNNIASVVAGGLYNPLVLKRFTKVWKAEEQLAIALPMYSNLEKKLNVKLDYKLPVYRLFASTEEQNNWFETSDKPLLENYVSQNIEQEINPNIKNNFGFGKVLQTGKIDTKRLITTYRTYLKQQQLISEQQFDFTKLSIANNSITYDTITANKIVFAEGYSVNNNPLFNYLPLDGTKGELITIHAPKLKLDVVLKSSVFLIPLGNDMYRLGATYNWKDKTLNTTSKGKEELLSKLDKFLKCKYTVINHIAGMRPTVKDRRPLLGQHPTYEPVYILNGLGTRGVMIGPYAANKLYDFIENNIALNNEVNINRYAHLHQPINQS